MDIRNSIKTIPAGQTIKYSLRGKHENDWIEICDSQGKVIYCIGTNEDAVEFFKPIIKEQQEAGFIASEWSILVETRKAELIELKDVEIKELEAKYNI